MEAAERKWRKPEAGEGGWEGIHQLPQPNSATPISHLPLPRQGITTYFSGNCTMEDAKLAQDFLDSQVWGLGNLRWWFVGVPLALAPTPGSQLGPRGMGILGP